MPRLVARRFENTKSSVAGALQERKNANTASIHVNSATSACTDETCPGHGCHILHARHRLVGDIFHPVSSIASLRCDELDTTANVVLLCIDAVASSSAAYRS